MRETVFLRDPDKIVPFRIVTEGSAARYLTGGDFDPESLQVRGDEVWIGEEFGPYLIRATLDGRVTGLFPTAPEGTELRSPDHPAVFVPAAAGADYRVGRSSGFEGMALSPDGSRLWALFEKPLLDAAGAPEGRFLRAYAFDPAAGAWTGETFKLALAEGATAIGDFNFVDDRRALVIERDDGEGDPSLACAGVARPECFPNPARLKRVLLVEVTPDAEGFARRLGEIDLMDVADRDGRARIATAAARDLTGRFTLPFQTIENVALWDDGRIVVALDNNLPFSTGRALDRAADGEFVLLDARALLDRR